jgi:hypothetical protein
MRGKDLAVSSIQRLRSLLPEPPGSVQVLQKWLKLLIIMTNQDIGMCFLIISITTLPHVEQAFKQVTCDELVKPRNYDEA